MIIFGLAQRFYASAARQLRRLESLIRSPIYSHFGETLAGWPTIVATEQQLRFCVENERRIDSMNRAHFGLTQAQRWLSTMLSLISSLVVFVPSLIIVLTRNPDDAAAAGIVGLVISNALMVS